MFKSKVIHFNYIGYNSLWTECGLGESPYVAFPGKPTHGTRLWKQVTCKNCLRRRNTNSQKRLKAKEIYEKENDSNGQ